MPYEDHRVDQASWPTLKPTMPFGTIPILEVTQGSNTYIISQSVTIARFLAKKFKLLGKSEQEQAECEM